MQIWRNGSLVRPLAAPLRILAASGLVVSKRVSTRVKLTLNRNHPCIESVLSTLSALDGSAYMRDSMAATASYRSINILHPLCHRSPNAFRLLVAFVFSPEPLTVADVASRLSDVDAGSLPAALGRLVRDGVLESVKQPRSGTSLSTEHPLEAM